MNSAPDFDITSLTERYFSWVVEAMTDMLLLRAKQASRRKPKYRWNALMNL
jgi:hypothetical protein